MFGGRISRRWASRHARAWLDEIEGTGGGGVERTP
jgi:cytochrome b subunit of formate dehydrogenase